MTSEARTIPRLPIDSSGIKSIGYAEDRQILAVEFHSGSVIHYDNVTLDTFEALGAAESRGKFYSREIKGKFSGRAMTGLCPQCKAAGYIGEPCECQMGVVREIDRTHKQQR